MSAEDNGGPAFPSHGSMGEVIQHGMTLRDYFAAMAMHVLFIGHRGNPPEPEQVAEDAYVIADAMLAERSKP